MIELTANPDGSFDIHIKDINTLGVLGVIQGVGLGTIKLAPENILEWEKALKQTRSTFDTVPEFQEIWNAVRKLVARIDSLGDALRCPRSSH